MVTSCRQPNRCALSMIEILVVIAIISILSALVVVGVRSLTSRSKASKTKSILLAARAGLELHAADRGSLPAPSEHPLAASRAPRLLFCRAGGTPLDTSNDDAYVGVLESQVIAAARLRVLLSDDRYSGGTAGSPRATVLPLLYGLRRDAIGLLGDPSPLGMPLAGTQPTITRLRRLPAPASTTGTVRDVNGDGNYSDADYPDREFLTNPTVTITGGSTALQDSIAPQKRAFEFIFASSTAITELTSLGALRTPEVERDAAGAALASSMSLDSNGRVWVHQTPSASWKSGRLQDGAGNWRAYLLRGPAIYDAYGFEVLYRIDAAGRVLLSSAGADGAFCWLPGTNGTYETDPHSAAPAGDDTDASTDNVVLHAN